MKRWIIENMCDRLDIWEGNTVCIGDLAYYIYQSAVADGSILYNTYLTREWIGKYLNDIADAIEDYELEDVLDFKTIYTNPEDFHVSLVYYLSRAYIMESNWVSEHEDEEIELTRDIIDTITRELKECIAC